LFEPLPFASACSDAVISVQAIHHARLRQIEALTHEIGRVLRPGGLLFVTVPQLRNQGTTDREIEPDTFIPTDGREKGLPHHYFTPETLSALFKDYLITDIHLDNTRHYCLTAFKQP
jgi:SAM-dependent methyltransferase